MGDCKKQNSYPTEAEALRAMRRIPPKASGVVPFRVYWCVTHKSFHFSSKAQHQRRK